MAATIRRIQAPPLIYYRLPLAHHKHMKSTNMLERPNQELKRCTHVARIFPTVDSCLRLIRALAVETHENWLECGRDCRRRRPASCSAVRRDVN